MNKKKPWLRQGIVSCVEPLPFHAPNALIALRELPRNEMAFVEELDSQWIDCRDPVEVGKVSPYLLASIGNSERHTKIIDGVFVNLECSRDFLRKVHCTKHRTNYLEMSMSSEVNDLPSLKQHAEKLGSVQQQQHRGRNGEKQQKTATDILVQWEAPPS